MTASKSSRTTVLRAMRDLMGRGHRARGDMTPFETFGFSMMPDTRNVDDRAIAIIVAAVLEQSLEKALLEKLIPLSEEDERDLFYQDNAPISSLDAKIRLAFALGIIGQRTKSDLIVYKHVRNCFAHSRLPLTFETDEIKAGLRTYLHQG